MKVAIKFQKLFNWLGLASRKTHCVFNAHLQMTQEIMHIFIPKCGMFPHLSRLKMKALKQSSNKNEEHTHILLSLSQYRLGKKLVVLCGKGES